jgi:hypothetical protein
MTAPEDDLEKALRQALSAAVSQVEPAADGLDRIRARTSRRLPQPWLLSIASAAIGRARNYVRRGYDALREHFFLGTTVSRVALGVGIAFLACIGLAVSPLRQTIVQVGSTVLTGNSGGGKSGGGGTPTGTGTETGSGRNSRGASRTAKGSPAPGSTRQSQCKPVATDGTASVTGIVAITLASPAQGPSDEAKVLPFRTRPAPQCSASASPAASASPPAVASLTPVASPSGTAPASSAASPSMSPSPTPASSPSAASTPTASPTGSGPATSPPATSSTGDATSGAVAPSLEPSVSPSEAGLTGSAP